MFVAYFQKLNQIAYATALLAAIAAAPRVTLHLELGEQVTTVEFDYPPFGPVLAYALGLTSLAMAPSSLLPASLPQRFPKLCFMAIVPWAGVALSNFFDNFLLQLRAIVHVSRGNHPQAIIFALFIYMGLLVCAMEQVMHWIAVHFLISEETLTGFAYCPKSSRFL